MFNSQIILKAKKTAKPHNTETLKLFTDEHITYDNTTWIYARISACVPINKITFCSMTADTDI